jgi:hypothetical protein
VVAGGMPGPTPAVGAMTASPTPPTPRLMLHNLVILKRCVARGCRMTRFPLAGEGSQGRLYSAAISRRRCSAPLSVSHTASSFRKPVPSCNKEIFDCHSIANGLRLPRRMPFGMARSDSDRAIRTMRTTIGPVIGSGSRPTMCCRPQSSASNTKRRPQGAVLPWPTTGPVGAFVRRATLVRRVVLARSYSAKRRS